MREALSVHQGMEGAGAALARRLRRRIVGAALTANLLGALVVSFILSWVRIPSAASRRPRFGP
jgi:hypothetical protein